MSKMGVGDDALAISVCREFSLKPDLRFWKFCTRFFFPHKQRIFMVRQRFYCFQQEGQWFSQAGKTFLTELLLNKISSRLSIGLHSQAMSNQADKIFFTLGHFV